MLRLFAASSKRCKHKWCKVADAMVSVCKGKRVENLYIKECLFTSLAETSCHDVDSSVVGRVGVGLAQFETVE